MCPRPGWAHLTLPLFVTLKRFLTAPRDFILGMRLPRWFSRRPARWHVRPLAGAGSAKAGPDLERNRVRSTGPIARPRPRASRADRERHRVRRAGTEARGRVAVVVLGVDRRPHEELRVDAALDPRVEVVGERPRAVVRARVASRV